MLLMYENIMRENSIIDMLGIDFNVDKVSNLTVLPLTQVMNKHNGL